MSKRYLGQLDFQNRLVRGLTAFVLVAVIGFGLWQAGILLRDPNEMVAITGASGDQVVINISAAVASLATPDSSDLGVAVEEGKLSPNFEVSMLTGERVQLADFRGRAVYLNSWATWCGPCRAEMPDIEQVLRTHEDAGLVVLAVNNGEPFSPARNFIADLGRELYGGRPRPEPGGHQALSHRLDADEHLHRRGRRHYPDPRRPRHGRPDGRARPGSASSSSR